MTQGDGACEVGKCQWTAFPEEVRRWLATPEGRALSPCQHTWIAWRKTRPTYSQQAAMGILGGGGNQDESYDQDDGDASIVSQLDPNTGQITFRRLQ